MIDAGVGQRQLGDVTDQQARPRYGLPSPREHALGDIHAQHVVAPFEQLLGHRARAAGRVERTARGQVVQHGLEDVVAHRKAAVVLTVVGQRPAVVTIGEGQRVDVDPRPQIVRLLEESAHLGQPGLGEDMAMLAREGA